MNKENSIKDTYENTVCVENISFSIVCNVFLDGNENYNSKELVNRIRVETMHSHAYNEIFICYDSGITIATSEGNIDLNPGEILLIPSGTVHFKMSCGSKWASIGFSYNNIRMMKSHDIYGQIDRLCKCCSPKIISRNSQISRELYEFLYKRNLHTASVSVILHILEILLRISEEFPSKISDKHISQNKEGEITRIAQLEKILGTQYMENVRLSSVAETLHISERQLGRILKKSFGMPFHKIITARRIQAACRMLCETDVSIEEIWNMVGFNNKSTFYTAFKKIVGLTPAEYKKISG